MKKFDKLKLRMFTEMSEMEMKNIMGGGGYGENGDGTCSMTCKGGISIYMPCNGVCVKNVTNSISCVTGQDMVSGVLSCN